MTDHQQAALTAMQDEIYRQLNCQYGDFNIPSNEEVKAILAAAEPHLRKKWAEELVERIGASNMTDHQLTDEQQIREQVAADIWEYWPFRRTARYREAACHSTGEYRQAPRQGCGVKTPATIAKENTI